MQMAEKANAKPRVRRTYKQLFLDELKKLSGGEQKIINNNTLRDALNWKEGRYKRIKDELADEKVIAATRGGPGGGIILASTPNAKAPQPLHVFISYSHCDQGYKDELIKHLSPLKRLNLIAEWHDRKIEPGDKWAQVISESLKKSDIVILLISIDFINSKYCYDVEMDEALDRASEGKTVIIPVIARKCIWRNTTFSSYQALPTDGKAIASWDNLDEALTVVAEGIQQVAERILSTR
jgi:TIR domain-containing protein